MGSRPADEAPVADAEEPVQRPKLTRKKTEKPALPPKLRLLQAATAEFAERGFAGARIDEIARKAQLNKQLIYHYFGGKQQMYEAVLSDMVRRLQVGGMHGGATEDDLRPRRSLELLTLMLETVQKPVGRQWVRLLMFEALQTSGPIHLEEPRRRAYRRGVDIVERARERGEIDPLFDPQTLRLGLFGLALIPILLPQITKLTTGEDYRSKTFMRRWAEQLVEIYDRLAPDQSDAQDCRPADGAK